MLLLSAPLFLAPAWSASKSREKRTEAAAPELLLEGGRKLTYERSFSWEREVKPKRGFWNRLVDIVAGEPEFHVLIRPYSVVTDSRGRIIVTDPGAAGVHIFDFAQQKYKFITRGGKRQGRHAHARSALPSMPTITSTSPIPTRARFSSLIATENISVPSAA